MKNISSYNPKKGVKVVKLPVDYVRGDDKAAEIVNLLFVELRRCFPAWRQSLKNLQELKDAKRVWVLAFVENGIVSTEQLDRGLRVARRSESAFLPSCGEFISWCQPSFEDVGLPELDDAYREACNAGRDHDWSHDAVHLAAMAVGRFDLARNPERLMLPKFKKHYEFYADRVMRGEVLQVALPKPPPKPVFGVQGEPVRPSEVVDFLRDLKRSLV